MELTLIKAKAFFYKLLMFAKLYWKEFIFGAILLYTLFFAKQKADLVNKLIEERGATRKAHQENIDKLTQQIRTEIETRHKIEIEFRSLVEKINQEHSEEVQRIALEHATQIKELVKLHQNNPELMGKTINDLLGIRVMSVSTERQPWEPA